MQRRKIEKVSVVGLGYIGLPTAAVVAARGIQVAGLEVSDTVVDTLNKGEVHIVEPELDVLVRSTVREGLLRAATTPEAADVFVIAVPTPFKSDYQPDLSFIRAAAETIAPVLRAGNLVILESTSPVGTTEKLSQWLSESRGDLVFPRQADEASPDIFIAHCPERVLPGHVLHELVENDRVIGGISDQCTQFAIDFYKIFVKGKLIPTDARTAEMAKLTENAFRDVNIAFANELAVICERLEIDVWELIKLANHHPRVNILNPGPGVGGHCIAVDPWFIVASAPQEARLISTARRVNDDRPGQVLEMIYRALASNEQKTIACLGLSFKANIDDLRESPALHIVEMLAKTVGNNLLVCEPHITELPAKLKDLPQVRFVESDTALDSADIVVLLVDHDEFRNIEKSKLANKKLIDTRGIFS